MDPHRYIPTVVEIMVDKDGVGSIYFKEDGHEETCRPEEGIHHRNQYPKPEVCRVGRIVAEDGGGVLERADQACLVG